MEVRVSFPWLQARLLALYFTVGNYEGALTLGSSLLRELKKLDDKALLVEVQLLESKVYHALSNLPKARSARFTIIGGPSIQPSNLRNSYWDFVS